jgi:hypothetical protein
MSQQPARRRNPIGACEECWLLVGQRRGRIWYARRIARSVGQPASVAFHGPDALAREERRGDLVGFYHTHPGFSARPSRRDLDTTRAWVGALGKPLLCLIEGSDGLAGWRFDSDQSSGLALSAVQNFPRGVVIAVEDEGVRAVP